MTSIPRDFPGGIHPPENKAQSVQRPIEKAPLPARLIIPVQQHIGAPPKVNVAVGDRVLKGQIIAEASEFVSLPVHASSSGTVTAIETRVVQHPSEIDGLCIEIEPDGEEKWVHRETYANYHELDRQQILECIRNAGIAGMGGAGFPAPIKLAGRPGTQIDYLILNAVECEPYITSDDMLMRERAEEIIAGLKIMAWLVRPRQTIIGIEDNKPEAIAAMRKACGDSQIKVIEVPTKYPSGGEKQIIQMLTGREVPSGNLPADAGVICQNTGTAYAVYRAVVHGEPLISRITTMTGNALSKLGNLEVLIGTPVSELLDHMGVNYDNLQRLVMGGPMMGFSLHSLNAPVVKTTNCLLAPTSEEFPDPAPEQPCIRCGSCAEVCPMSLLPQQLYWYSRSHEFDQAESYNLFDCIECGACSYVCPSNIPLVQYFRFGKGEIRRDRLEQQKSDQARVRFESRKARLEEEDRLKEEKRRARAAAAAKKQAAKKAAPAATGNETTENSTAPPVNSAAPLTVLKTAAATSLKRWKDAEKALKVAEIKAADQDTNENRAYIEKLQLKVSRLKENADADKTRLQAQIASEKAPGQENAPSAESNLQLKPESTSGENRIKELKVEAAVARARAKKAQQQLDIARESGAGPITELEQTATEALRKAEQTELALKAAKEAQ